MGLIDFHQKPDLLNLPRWLFLGVLSWLYRAAAGIDQGLYLRGWKTSYRPAKPVISVGNLTVGGTGKTPLVDWLLEFYQELGIRPAVLTRGYKAHAQDGPLVLGPGSQAYSADQTGDEPLLLHLRHPQVPIHVGADRVAAAQRAEQEADLLILDDGFQHYRLQRDLDLVLFDAHQGLGNGHRLPLGPLREGLSGLKRAGAVLLTKCNLADPKPLEKQLAPWLAGQPVFELGYLAQGLAGPGAERLDPAQIQGKTCLLFSGIGNPRGFESSVLALGGQVVGHLVAPDHQEFTPDWMAQIQAQHQALRPDFLICTEKDRMRLVGKETTLPPLHCLLMSLQVPAAWRQFLLDWSRSVQLIDEKNYEIASR